jgi:hypothetical protein
MEFLYPFSCLPKLLLQKGLIEVNLLDCYKALEISWVGNITNEDSIFTLEEVLKFTHKHAIENWILDARESIEVEPIDGAWQLEFFASKLPQTKVKKIARLASYNFHLEIRNSEMITIMMKEMNPPYTFAYKADANEAIEWFMEK